MTSWFDTEGAIIHILRGILDDSYDLKDPPHPGQYRQLIYEGLRILESMNADTHSFAHGAGEKGWSDKPQSHVQGASYTLDEANKFLEKLKEAIIPKH